MLGEALTGCIADDVSNQAVLQCAAHQSPQLAPVAVVIAAAAVVVIATAVVVIAAASVVPAA